MTGIVVTVSTALFSFIFIPQYGVMGYVGSMNLAYLSGALYSLLASGTYRYFHVTTFSSVKCRDMLKYSIPLIPNGIMWWFVGAFNRPVMEANVGLEGIGLFAVANKFPGILTMLFTVFTVSWQISVFEEYGKKDFSLFYNKIVRFIMFLVILIFFVISIGAKFFIQIFASQDFYDACIYVPILTLAAVLSSASSLCGVLFSVVRKSKYTFYSSVWGGIMALVFNFILIPMFGVMGAALAVLLSFFVMMLSRFIYAWQYVKIEQLYKYTAMICLALISIGVIYYCDTYISILLNIFLLLCIAVINRDLFKSLRIVSNFAK